MRPAFEVIGAALADLWETLIPSALCSVLWLLCMLLVVPSAPATLALAEMAQRVHTRDTFTPGDYVAALWRNFGLGWRWGAIAFPVTIVLLVDYQYAEVLLAPALVRPARLFVVAALVLWALLQLYALALLFEQEQPRVGQALRNAAVMALKNPLYSLTLVLIAGILCGLSLLLIVVNFLLGPMFFAFLGRRAVMDRVAAWRAQTTTRRA